MFFIYQFEIFTYDYSSAFRDFTHFYKPAEHLSFIFVRFVDVDKDGTQEIMKCIVITNVGNYCKVPCITPTPLK